MRDMLLGVLLALAASIFPTAADQAPGQDDTAWKTHMQSADAARAKGDLAGTAQNLEAARAEVERLDLDQKHLAATLVQLGVAYNQLGQYARAEPIVERAAATIESVVGSDHEAVSLALAPWALSLLRLSRPMEALKLLERAYGIVKAHGGAESIEAVTILEAWAEADERVGWYLDAQSKLEQAIRTVEKAAGSEHPALVPLLNRQASVLKKMGKLREADAASARASALKAAVSHAPPSDQAGAPRYRGKTAREWSAAFGTHDRTKAYEAYLALLEADPSAVPVLVELMGDPLVPVRMAASHALALLAPKDPERVMPTLTTALKDRSLAVRCWAADGLGAIGPAAAPAVPALVATLKTNPRSEPDLEGPHRYYADARMGAATALGKIGPAAAAAAGDLREALEDEVKDVRTAAKEALHRIECPKRR